MFTADFAVMLPGEGRQGARPRGTSTKRSRDSPLPTVNEALASRLRAIAWFGAYAPAGTPADALGSEPGVQRRGQ